MRPEDLILFVLTALACPFAIPVVQNMIEREEDERIHNK